MKTLYQIEEELIVELKQLSEHEIIGLHNEYCSLNSYYGDYIEFIDCFDEQFYGMQIQDFLRIYDISDFNFNDKYYQCQVDGTLESFNWVDEYILYPQIATMIIEDYKYYMNNHCPQDIIDFIEENIEYLEE